MFREGAWGFWLQQAVEKSLKAWLLHLVDDDPPLTHDLRRLLRLIAARGADPGQWLSLGVPTVYAVQFRYDADPAPLSFCAEGLTGFSHDLQASDQDVLSVLATERSLSIASGWSCCRFR